MTQQATQPSEAGSPAAELMNATEFDERHYRTGQCIARVSKLWEQVAEEQQAIVDGQGYKHMNYDTWVQYWDTEWKQASGWPAQTIKKWIYARLNKMEAYNASSPGRQVDSLGPRNWETLGRIKDPSKRLEFLDKYEDEIKPRLKAQGVSSQIFHEGVKEFNNERTVQETVTPEEMANLPSGEFNKQQEFASRLPKTAASMDAHTPEDIAQACIDLYPERIDWHIEWADKISTWAAQYRDELVAHQRQGIHAVK